CRDHPARLLPRRNRCALLPLPERARRVVRARHLRQVDRMQLAFAVALEPEQEKCRREAVADARLDRDTGAKLACERVQPDALLVRERAGFVAARRLDDSPVLLVASL